jgi:putative heme-binding domain-containing protein
LLQKWLALTDDSHARVRYRLAFALGDVAVPEAQARVKEAIIRLALKDHDDSWMRTALLSSCRHSAAEIMAALIRQREILQQPSAVVFVQQLSETVLRQGSAEQLKLLGQALTSFCQDDPERFVDFLQSANWSATHPLVQNLDRSQQQAVSHAISRRLEQARDVIGDAIHRFGISGYESLQPMVAPLLNPSVHVELGQALLQVIAKMDDPRVAEDLLSKWASLTPAMRVQVLLLLSERKIWRDQLTIALESGAFERTQLPQMTDSRVNWLNEWLAKSDGVTAQPTSDERKRVVEQFASALQLKGEVDEGRKLAVKHCSKCHKVENEGAELGPSLSAAASRGNESIIVAVLDPNREVNPQFVNYLVETVDGRTLSGLISGESATSITLANTEGKQIEILRADMTSLTSTRQSLMPDGFEKEISNQQMADLLSYLQSLANR